MNALSHEDMIRSLSRVEGQQDQIIELQREILTRQKETNGHVNSLRTWRDVHTEQHLKITADAKLAANAAHELANRVQGLFDVAAATAAEKRVADRRSRWWFAVMGILAAFFGGAGISLVQWLISRVTR